MRKDPPSPRRRMRFTAPQPMSAESLQALDPPLCCEEWAMLDMLRCLFVMHAERSDEGWSAARSRGAWYFGPRLGGRILIELADYLETLRRSRISPFWFSDPRCACCRTKITDQEKRMLTVVRARRMGLKEVSITTTLVLCEGMFDERFLESADRLGALLNEAERTPHPASVEDLAAWRKEASP